MGARGVGRRKCGRRAGSPPSDQAPIQPQAFREGRDGTLGRAVQFGGDSAQVCPRPNLIVGAIGHGWRVQGRDAAACYGQAVSCEPKSLYPIFANTSRLRPGR